MVTKYPPQLSLSEAKRVIKEMYATHKSKEVSLDLMPNILKVKQKSSYFLMSISALQKFGLVERRPHSIIELTEFAMQIIEPIGNEEAEAILSLFKKDEVLSALLDKYPNGLLPSEEQLKQTLMKTFNIPRNTINKWYQFVVESFRELPTTSQKKSIIPSMNETDKFISPHLRDNVGATISNYQNLQLPSGKNFSFQINDGYTKDDLDFITDFFELKKKRLI